MRFNVFLSFVALFSSVFGTVAIAEEEVPAFREPLYFSDVDRENRSPQAVRVGGVVFVSAISGRGSTIEQQTRTAYMRLQSILGNYGLKMADVAQERVFVKEGVSLDALIPLRPLFYGEDSGPASTLVRVAGFEDPNAMVSIEVVAVANPESES